MKIFDTKELIKLVNKGCREYRVLVDYLRHARDIENIENLEKEIKDLFPKEKDIYVELSNYYTKKNNISKSIENLEKYRGNGGQNSNVLDLLKKQYSLVYSIKIDETNKELLNIFNEKQNIDVLIKELKNILESNKNYDHYELTSYMEKFLHELNVKCKTSEIELFFNKIYPCIPIGQLKLRNIILNEYEMATKKVFLKSYPRTVEFVLTNKCNFRCIMCDDISHVGNFVASDKLVDDLLEIMPHIKLLILRGGEIFLDARFDKILYEAKKNNVELDLITNGSLLNNNNLNELIDYDKLVITLSIDSLDKKIYETIRERGSFDKLIYNINLLNKLRNQKKSKANIAVNMVVMSINYMEIEKMIEFVGKNHFNILRLIPVLCNENFKYNLDLNIQNILNKNRRKYFDIAKKYNINLVNMLPLTSIDGNNNIKENNNNNNNNDFCNIDTTQNIKSIFCMKPYYSILVDQDVPRPTCHCKILEREKNINFNNTKDNAILGEWNNTTFCTYRKDMISNNNKFCSDKCLKNNKLLL